jgi:MinD superfamily P-loop ATPase
MTPGLSMGHNKEIDRILFQNRLKTIFKENAMAYMITEKCIECGSCQSFCKNKAIKYTNKRYVIDETKCEMCGTCLEYCPIDNAIVENHQVATLAV